MLLHAAVVGGVPGFLGDMTRSAISAGYAAKAEPRSICKMLQKNHYDLTFGCTHEFLILSGSCPDHPTVTSRDDPVFAENFRHFLVNAAHNTHPWSGPSEV